MSMPLKSAPPQSKSITERQRVLKRLTSLEKERASWLAHWQELNDYIFPRKFRYLATDRNKGTKRNNLIINNKATRAARVLGAGKMAGMTSPARPWFRYTVSDPAALSDPEVKAYTSALEKIVNETFARSNLYSKIHELWVLQGVFHTAALYVEEDEEDDVRGHVFPLGQYVLAATAKGRIDYISRQFGMTIDQIVREFGLDNCSPGIREAYKNGLLDEFREVIHTIEPNVNRETGKIDNLNMPFVSTWYEKAAPEDWTKPLRRSGFEEFPVMVARWDVVGEDIYGSGGPGMDALGDIKALQLLEKRKAEAVDKTVRPPMKAPVSARAQKLSLLPGDVSYVDETAQGARFEPAIVIKAESINAAEASIREHENRIVDTFYANLFLMMQMDERQQPATAREINERHEEKMLQLGPVVERDQDEVLDPLHNRVVQILSRRGKLPPTPEKLKGGRIKVEYISIMSQAQKLLGTSSTERFVSFVGSTSAVAKDVLQIPNWDAIVRRYAENLGLAPEEVNTEEMVAQLRAQAMAAAQEAQMGADLATAVKGAQVASQTDMGGDTALSRLINTVGGGQGPLGG